jgi:two-component system nitrogen regulation response regulator GlnG
MPDGNGLEMLPRITLERPELPVIVISAQNTIMTAIQATEADAYDYLPKPFDLPDLMKRVARGLERKRHVQVSATNGSAPHDDLPLVGRTPKMQALYRLVARVMNTDLPVLIFGESGSGKSLIARAIHDFSDRRTMPFVVATASDLEGFDAPSDLLERARGGSILFDEVGDLSLAAQARVVRMMDGLEAGSVRMMATTQADLARRVGEGFRSDLYYRLAGAQVDVPSLRERVDDIPLLASHFLQRAERDGGAVRRFSDDAMDAVRTHAWPGNVRQLENVVRRLVATSSADEITRSEVDGVLGPANSNPAIAGSENLSMSVERHLRRLFDLQAGQLPPAGLYQRVLKQVEAPLIEIALDATGGNQARCGDLLGINRNTLRKRITDLEIPVTRRRRLM